MRKYLRVPLSKLAVDYNRFMSLLDEPMIVPKGDWSDESFESTEESDATVDFCETAGYTHNNFQNTEVVWAKRPGLPWFPGIVSFIIFFFLEKIDYLVA